MAQNKSLEIQKIVKTQDSEQIRALLQKFVDERDAENARELLILLKTQQEVRHIISQQDTFWLEDILNGGRIPNYEYTIEMLFNDYCESPALQVELFDEEIEEDDENWQLLTSLLDLE